MGKVYRQKGQARKREAQAETGAPGRRLTPAALSIEELVRLLTEAGGNVTEAQIEADLAVGAPRNRDGTVHLVHYTAWLVREAGGK